MDVITVTARTVDEAVNKALIELEVTSDKLDYEVLEKGSTGFLGIGAKPAVIRARRKEGAEDIMKEFSSIPESVSGEALREQFREDDAEKNSVSDSVDISGPLSEGTDSPVRTEEADAPGKAEEADAAESGSTDSSVRTEEADAPGKAEEADAAESSGTDPSARIAAADASAGSADIDNGMDAPFEGGQSAASVPKKKPSPIANPDEVCRKAEEFLEGVFKAMNLDVTVETSVNQEDREICVNLSGDDMGILIGKRGQTLDSLQYLSSLVINRGVGEYIRVRLDTENYRERRKETLETLARNIAYKVKKTRIPVALEPMNPYERRIIHSALQNDRYVLTRSEGEEPYRHVIIFLKKNKDEDIEPVPEARLAKGRRGRNAGGNGRGRNGRSDSGRMEESRFREGGRTRNRDNSGRGRAEGTRDDGRGARRGGRRYDRDRVESRGETAQETFPDNRPDSETMPVVRRASEVRKPETAAVPKWRKDSEKYGNSISVEPKNTEE
jgi:spoIIIJ-associated protein